MKVRHMVPNYELNIAHCASPAQRGRNSRKNSPDSPFSMLNSVNTEIFITLNDQRRLNNKSFRTAAFRHSTMTTLGAACTLWCTNRILFGTSRTRESASSSTHSRSGRNTNAALPPVCSTNEAATASSSTEQVASCLCGALFGGRRICACVAVEIRRVADNVIHTAVRQQRTHLPEVALQSGYVFQLVCRDGLLEQVERAVLQFQSGDLEVGAAIRAAPERLVPQPRSSSLALRLGLANALSSTLS